MSLHFHTATEKSLKHDIRHGSASILHIAVWCYNTYNYTYILKNYVATFVTTEMWTQCHSPLQWAAAAQVSCTLHLLKWVRRASHTPPHGLHWWQWPAEGCIDAEEHGTTCSANGDGLYTRVLLTKHKVERYTWCRSEEGKEGESQWNRASVLQIYTQPSSSWTKVTAGLLVQSPKIYVLPHSISSAVLNPSTLQHLAMLTYSFISNTEVDTELYKSCACMSTAGRKVLSAPVSVQ